MPQLLHFPFYFLILFAESATARIIEEPLLIFCTERAAWICNFNLSFQSSVSVSMDFRTRLDYALFQLTPTRTRYYCVLAFSRYYYAGFSCGWCFDHLIARLQMRSGHLRWRREWEVGVWAFGTVCFSPEKRKGSDFQRRVFYNSSPWGSWCSLVHQSYSPEV